MAKNSRSYVRLYDEHDRFLKFLPFEDATLRVRNGQFAEKKRAHGRLIEVKIICAPPPPSDSKNSPTLITAGECKTNAFAKMKMRLGEKLNAAEEMVLEKVAGFTPGAIDEFGNDVYLGPSWGDRIIVHPA